VCGNDPAALRFEHLPSFPVDVVRRWPSVEKAKRLLGWDGPDRRARGDRADRRMAARPARLTAGVRSAGVDRGHRSSGLRPF
jgi:hypothetical protein